MARNERQLVFGLADADRIEELTIAWPSGHKQTFHDLPAGRHFLFVEGRTEPLSVRAGGRAGQ